MIKKAKLRPSHKPASGRRARIEDLMRRCEELSGGAFVHWHAEDCPPEILEAFLESVVQFETASRSSLRERLQRQGCETPRPDQLRDSELPAKIQEVARALAKNGFYLERTDHLSDRELYDRLWNNTLEGEFEELPQRNGIWRVDLAGSGSEEDLLVHLRYYADEEERREWRREFPDFEMPEPGKLPFDRDRFLPQPSADR